MAKFQDLSGQKFNRLTVIRRDESVLNKVSWICKCECGNEISVTTSHLKCGHTQSCGCLQKEKAREANFLDLTGQRFGRLTVIKEADKYISPQGLKFVQWLCKCDCGNDTIVLATNLKKGTTKSCGCYSIEQAKKRLFKDLTGQKFGRLTAIKPIENHTNSNGKSMMTKWFCRCDCGNECNVQSGNLLSGHTLSCGCYNKEQASKRSLINLVGQRFGRLTVLERVDDIVSPSGNVCVAWKCKCDCGNETIIRSSSLLQGNTKSCGCLVKEICTTTLIKDLTGLRFGMLTVLERADNKTYSSGINRVAWKCKCDCGNEKVVLSSLLISGETKSCGCMASSGEYNLIIYFLNNNVNYEYQKRFEDCRGIGNKPLSYDFYLPNHNMLIECQGEQHERPIEYFGGEEQFIIQQEHDRRKREYAKDNGYKLLEISYKDYNNIENILTKAIN